MLLHLFSGLALSLSFTNAFTDTSPFFMFSTSEYAFPTQDVACLRTLPSTNIKSRLLSSTPQITSASTLLETLTPQLSTCPSDTYIIVTQPGVHAEDYSDRYSAPHLRRKVLGEDERVRSTMSVMDVLGDVDAEKIVGMLEQRCGAVVLKVDTSTGSFAVASDPHPRVINLAFPALPSGKTRASKLQENDVFLASMLDLLPTSKYTVIYTTTPSSASLHKHTETVQPEIYEMDPSFSAPQEHMGMKRDFVARDENAGGQGNVTLVDAALFERYQFFTPGIFMGILISLPLFFILYVGISAVGSLQVSYAAFDKEMGPAVPKKQQ
ncbi:MAG: hypothetical protein Q9186_003355 [Xanthomendoza sp. 1 TL-2023]